MAIVDLNANCVKNLKFEIPRFRLKFFCYLIFLIVIVVTLSSSADTVLSSSAQTRLPTTEISNILASPAVTRPRTARAALQKHHLHRSLQPWRGSPQTNTH